MKRSLLKELAASLRRTPLLREAPEDDKEAGEDSLDAQVDKYLSSYESEAKNAKSEGLDIRLLSRRLMREADEDEDKEKEDEDKEGEEEEPAEEPEKLKLEDIDMGSFVSDVMRLVDNYDTLLEVRNTILRRAANYLVDNYEGDAAEAFKEELLESYGVEVGKSKADEEDEFQAPKAGAAGPVGGGA